MGSQERMDRGIGASGHHGPTYRRLPSVLAGLHGEKRGAFLPSRIADQLSFLFYLGHIHLREREIGNIYNPMRRFMCTSVGSDCCFLDGRAVVIGGWQGLGARSLDTKTKRWAISDE